MSEGLIRPSVVKGCGKINIAIQNDQQGSGKTEGGGSGGRGGRERGRGGREGERERRGGEEDERGRMKMREGG